MDSLKKSLAEVVAAKLRGELTADRGTENIPGVRVLARKLGASVPIICQALHLLCKEGILERGGERRRWQRVTIPLDLRNHSLGDQESERSGTRPKKVMFLASAPLSREGSSSVEIFAALLDRLYASDWELIYRVEPFIHANKPRRSWSELLEFTKPDAMIVHGGTPIVAEWATKKSIRCLFLGGDCGTSSLPMIASRTANTLSDAATRLFACGHRRILFPLCGRLPNFVERCGKAAHLLGDRERNIIVAESSYSGPEVIRSLLRRQWALSPPDALILLDWQEFIAAIGFFNEAGIRIPRDVSLVMLSGNPSMEWHLPSITHYHVPANQFAKQIAKWLLEENTVKRHVGLLEIKAHWVEMQSVIPRFR